MPKRGNYHNAPRGKYRAALMYARRQLKGRVYSHGFICCNVDDYCRYARPRVESAVKASGRCIGGSGFYSWPIPTDAFLISKRRSAVGNANRRRRKFLTTLIRSL